MIVNTQPIPERLLQQYKAEGSIPVANDLTGSEGPEVIAEELLEIVELEGKPTVKHDSRKLAKLIWSRRAK